MGSAEPPRIAVVSNRIPPEYSGAGLSAYKRALQLQSKGKLSALLTASPNPTIFAPKFGVAEPLSEDRIRRVDATLKKGVSSKWQRMAHALQLPLMISRRFRELTGDAAMIHAFSLSWLTYHVVRSARRLKVPVVLEVTLLEPEEPDHWWMSPNGWKKRYLYAKADRIVCLSSALVESVLAWGVPKQKIRVIPRAVDTDRFAPPSADQRNRLRQVHQVPIDADVLLFVGGCIQRKGYDLLIPAVLELMQHRPKLFLLVMGNESDLSASDRLIHDRNLNLVRVSGFADRIRYGGVTVRIEDYYAIADAAVLPSRREGFPNVLVEAMASCLPVCSYRIPGITDRIISDGKDGFLFDSDTVPALIDSLTTTLDCDRDRIGGFARQTVTERYSTGIVDACYEALYSEILDPVPC